MGIEHESVVDHPLTEVFAWHTRPGAMRRLVPPWQPMKVLAEAGSLADGRAVLGLPGGLRWVAQHDPAAFDPPYRFVDGLSSQGPTSWPARVIGWWRHTHEFSEVAGGTRVYDHVDTSALSPCPSGGWATRLRGECPQPVPTLGPRLRLGEQGARELAEANQRVVPTKLETLGHRFRRPRIDDALAHELGHG